MRTAGAVTLDGSPDDVHRARKLAAALSTDNAELRDDVALVISELTSNACLHGMPPVTVTVLEDAGRVRVEVRDAGRALPVRPRFNADAMTGRGFALVAAVSNVLGVDPHPAAGKTVWAELVVGADQEPFADADLDAMLQRLAADDIQLPSDHLHTVRLGAVPTELLLAAKTHIDDVVRELELVATSADGADQQLPAAVQTLVDAVTRDFALARAAIKRQALEAAARGDHVTDLTLHLPLSAADAGERYLAALEEIDRHSRSARMLTLAPPRSHVAFRRWYLHAVIDQLRAASRGESPPEPTSFLQVLSGHVDELAALLETQTRLRLLQSVNRRLTDAESVEEMARLVVDSACEYDGVESGRVFLLDDRTLRSVAWQGAPAGSDDVFSEFSLDDDLPGAEVARTGEPLHARALAELYARFPEFGDAGLYPQERSLHVVPLTIAGNVIGLLTLTFRAGEVADDAQQQFVTAIADALAQAIERSLANDRVTAERQRELSLLQAQAEALAGVVGGTPLMTVLDNLLRSIEAASRDGMLASVLLLAEDGQHLRHGSAPSLPADYNAAVDGLDIGPKAGSCGTAAFRRERVIVSDIATDPLWEDFRELADRAGVRACWSTPITDQDGVLLGTFALYYRTPHAPSAEDLAFVDVLVSTVALIIERSRAAAAEGQPLLQDEAAQRLALELAVGAGGVGTFDWNLVTGDLVWDEQLLEIFGLGRDHERVLTIEDFFDVVHPGDRDRVKTLLDRAIADIADYEAEYRIVLPDGSPRWIAARGRALAGRERRTTRLVGAAQDTTARRDADARVARVMDSLSTAFFFLDRAWRFTFVNAEAERVLGRRRSELLDRTIWEEFPASVGSDFEVYYRQAMDSGERVSFDAYYPEPLNAWYEVQAWPSPDGLAVYFIDVTKRRAAQEAAQRAIDRAGLLARVSEDLARTLEPQAAMRSLVRIITPTVADWCVVTLIGDDAHAGTRRGLGESLGWHSDPDLRALADHYARTRLLEMTDDALIVKAVETADPQIVNGDAMVALREMFEAGSEPLAILEQLDTYAIALLPLVGQEHPVGMLSVVNTSRRGPFSDEDLDLLREIAARAGLVLDRARLYRQQRNVAEGLQRSMLHPPLVPDRLGVAVAYVPAAEIAQVGGDWYDAFMHPDGTTTLIIGDVMGHDVLAAAAMGETRTLVRTLAAQHAGAPARTIDDTERVMRQLHLDTLATVVVGRLESSDPAAGLQFRFANAGHPPPLLLHPDGRVDVLTDDTVDPLLGVGSDPRGERVAPVDVGSTLVLYTDGLVERRDQPVEVGIDRLCTTLSTLAHATPQQVVDAILDTMLPERSEDDIALLVVRV